MSDSGKMGEFENALKKKDDEGLKDAFRVLGPREDGKCTLEDGHLQSAVKARDSEITKEKANEIIQEFNQQGLFSCEDFVYIVKVIVAVKNNAFENAFKILNKEGTVGVKDVQLTAIIRDVELQNAKKTIGQVNKPGLFNYKEFLQIIKLLEEPIEQDQKNAIYEKLCGKDEQQTVILYGKAGVGKTWLAREVANTAVRKPKPDFDYAIWVYLNRIYKDDASLKESIAYQLCALSDYMDEEKAKAEEEAKKKANAESAEEAEEKAKAEVEAKKKANAGNAEEEKAKAEEEAKKKANAESAEEEEEKAKAEEEAKKKAKAEEEAKKKANKEKTRIVPMKKKGVILDKVEKKKILFVLDGDGSGMSGEVIEYKGSEAEKRNFELKLSAGEKVVRMNLGALATCSVMKTVRDDKQVAGENVVMVKPFSWERSMKLADRAMEAEKVEKNEKVRELLGYFMFRSERLPSQILLISRIVSYLGREGEPGLRKLEDDMATIKKEEKDVMLLDVLIKRYEERLPKSVLIDCYGPDTPESHFMRQHRPVNFNELICYWIMEGHLGPFDRVHEAYHKGHRVFMELMDCGLLQKQEADFIAPSGATTFKFHIHDYEEFFSGVRPGIGATFDMSLGMVALGDGMIRTIGNTYTNTKLDNQVISTLLLYGNRIGEEECPTENLLEHKERVEILALSDPTSQHFNLPSDPTSQHFNLPILEMEKLRLLALRGCQFLTSLGPFLVKKPDKKPDEEEGESPQESDKETPQKSDKETPQKSDKETPQEPVTTKLEGLIVLEISGPNTQINDIPDQLFTLMPNLKTVNLSHLCQVKTLPTSFYSLTQIEFLVLRGCESLQELGSLKEFKDLKILDVSGSTSFEKFDDKSLHTNTKLQILNLSKTNLKTLPLINQLKDLKFVWLKGCPNLPRIRKLDKMQNLQIFDISGAAEVERFCDPSLEDLMNLVTINISNTKIRRLPANLGDPTYLYASNCLRIKVVPPVEGLKKLQELDLSGCINLTKVRQEFFKDVKLLRSLNLSRTNVRELPFLDNDRSSLRVLLLSGCKLLEKVGGLKCLKELEHLDLSGCEKVMELEEGTFDEMKHLEHLNLSGTGIGKPTPMPSLSKLENLKELHVRECRNLKELPGVEQVKHLKLLDCSGTVLETPLCNDHPRPSCLILVGGGVKRIDRAELLRNLGAEQGGVESKELLFNQEDVNQCNWNMRIGSEATLIYGVHFLRLLKENPPFRMENLSKFCFLVYPSELEVKMKDRFGEERSYGHEVSLREIYLEKVCGEKMKMEKCLEIREFKKLPQSVDPLIEQAQLVVLVEVPFLVSLLDLRRMPIIKACWIERCSEFKYVFAAPEKKEEEGKSEEDKQPKNGELKKGLGDTPQKAKEKNSADGESSAKDQGNEASAHNLGESGKGQADQPAEVKSGGDDSKNENLGESAKGKDDEHGKSGDTANIEGNQPENASADNSKDKGDQQKNEKSGDVADQKNPAAEDTTKIGGDEKKNDADAEKPENENAANDKGDQQKNEKSGDLADQQNPTAEDTPKIGGDEKKNEADADGKSGDAEKPENENDAGDQQKNEKSEDLADQKNPTAEDTTKIGGNKPEDDKGDQQKNEKSGDVADQKNAAAENTTKVGGEEKKNDADAANNQGNQQKNAAGDADTSKIGGDEQKTSVADAAAKNPAEELEILWISHVLNMESICKGDIQSVTFKSLKTLYLEYCPNLSEICSSSLQLENLETLYIKYCHKLVKLFADENPSRTGNLSHLHLWGLDKLQKINCQTPSLAELRVGECPLLKYVIATPTVTDPKAENEHHDNLKSLSIKSCDSLKAIFESEQFAVLDILTELELCGLPKLEKVSMQAQSLHVLRVEGCPSLTTLDAANEARGLEKLEVKTCEKLAKIPRHAESNLKSIKLLGLPQLKLDEGEPKLIKKTSDVIWACPNLNYSQAIEEK